MWRTFLITAGVLGVLAMLLAWTAQTATFLFRHPKSPDVRVEIDHETGGAVVTQVAKAARGEPTGLPMAVVEKPEFDFGTSNPLTPGRHVFVVHNGGDVPLKLTKGSTTCKCTLSNLASGTVAPGEETQVTLEWTTGSQPAFSHAATIYTNDPLHKSLELRVHGRVRMRIGADVTEMVVSDLTPGEPAVAECLVYSQLWDRFEIQDVRSTLVGLKWEAAAIDPQSADRLAALAVWRLRLTIPGDLPSGGFADVLQVHVTPPEGTEPEVLALPLQGKVLRRASVFSPLIDSQGVIDLGNLKEGQGKQAKLLLKLRDPEPLPEGNTVEVFPPFLIARLTPRESAEAKGLYDLYVELPAATPPCQYLGTPQGRITIHTGHPRVKDIDLKVQFSILPASGG